MRDIIKELYGNVEKGMENIACTNIIKCNTNGEKNVYSDRTPNDIKDNCIASGIFEKEIEIMSPKHVIFLTGEKYDKYIREFYFGCSDCRDEENNRIYNGKILNWRRSLFNRGKLKYFILRTSYPQGQKKKIFIKNINNWLKETTDSY